MHFIRRRSKANTVACGFRTLQLADEQFFPFPSDLRWIIQLLRALLRSDGRRAIGRSEWMRWELQFVLKYARRSLVASRLVSRPISKTKAARPFLRRTAAGQAEKWRR